MKEQLLITFKAWEFVGIGDDEYFDVINRIPRACLVDLIASAICWQLDFDNEEHVAKFNESVYQILGYKITDPSDCPERDALDVQVANFVVKRVKALGYMMPDRVNFDYLNRKVYLDSKSDTVYLIVGYYVA